MRNAELACLLVAHAPKGTALEPRDPVLGDLFGSQVLGAKVDAGFICRDFRDRRKKTDDAEEDLELRAAQKPLKEIRCVKVRDGELIDPRVGRIVPKPHRFTGVEPPTVATFAWEGKSPDHMKAEHRRSKESERIVDLLRGLELSGA